MSIVERDTILRMIRRMAEMLGRAMGLRKAGQLEEAAEVVKATADAVFGPLWETLERLDEESAAALLRAPEKIAAYASITAERGELWAAAGQPKRGAASSRRATRLFDIAVARGASLTPEQEETRARIAEPAPGSAAG